MAHLFFRHVVGGYYEKEVNKIYDSAKIRPGFLNIKNGDLESIYKRILDLDRLIGPRPQDSSNALGPLCLTAANSHAQPVTCMVWMGL